MAGFWRDGKYYSNVMDFINKQRENNSEADTTTTSDSTTQPVGPVNQDLDLSQLYPHMGFDSNTGSTQPATNTASNGQSKPETKTTSATSNSAASNSAASKPNINSVDAIADMGNSVMAQGKSTVDASLAAAQQAANVVSGAASGGGYSGSGSSNPNQAYIDQLNSIYQQIMDRGPWDKEFQYDLNGDALYKQYADQYARMGQQAMQDTVAEASALTGGYGNSWAATAGSQAYQDYLGQLNSIVPALQQQAYDQYLADYDRWNDETNRLLTLYDLTAAHPGVVSALRPSYGGYASKPTAVDVANAGYEGLASSMDIGSILATMPEETRKQLAEALANATKKKDA